MSWEVQQNAGLCSSQQYCPESSWFHAYKGHSRYIKAGELLCPHLVMSSKHVMDRKAMEVKELEYGSKCQSISAGPRLMLLTFGIMLLLKVRAMARLLCLWENKGETGKTFSPPRKFLYFAA